MRCATILLTAAVFFIGSPTFAQGLREYRSYRATAEVLREADAAKAKVFAAIATRIRDRDSAEAAMSGDARRLAQAKRQTQASQKASELRSQIDDLQKQQRTAARTRRGEEAKRLAALVIATRKAADRLDAGELEVVAIPQASGKPDRTILVDRDRLLAMGGDYGLNYDDLGFPYRKAKSK